MANFITKYLTNITTEAFKRFLTTDQLEILFNTSNGVSYNQPISYANAGYTTYPTGDNRVASTLISSVVKDPYIKGMLRVYKNLLFKRGWVFGGGKNSAKALTRHLKNLNIDQILEQIFYADVTHGNGILFITDKGKLRFEPFLAEGYQRVKIVPDYINREIVKYEVYTALGDRVLSIDANKVLHTRDDNEDGDFRFGTGTMIACIKPWLLKQEAFTDSQNRLRDGSNVNGVFYPKFDYLKDNPDQIQNAMEGYKKFLMEVTQNRTNKRGQNLFSPTPIGFDKFTMSNVEMQTLGLITEVRKEFAAATGISLAVVGDTSGVSYSNAEQGRDNVSELLVEAKKRVFEEYVLWVLKNTLPMYNEDLNPFYFGREPTDEEILAYNAKTQRVQAQASIIQTLQTNPNYKLDLEKMEIVEVANSEVTQTVPTIVENEPETEEAIDESNEVKRSAPKIKIIAEPEKFMENKAVKKLQARLQKSITEQIQNARA